MKICWKAVAGCCSVTEATHHPVKTVPCSECTPGKLLRAAAYSLAHTGPEYSCPDWFPSKLKARGPELGYTGATTHV